MKIIFKNLIIIITIMSLFVACTSENMSGVLSEEQMIKNINKIAQRYTDRYAKAKVSTDIKDIPDKWVTLTEEDKARYNMHIYITGDDSFFPQKEPVQIYAIFDCFLYLRSQALETQLFGIMWDYQNGGIDSPYYKLTLIRTTEFEELYKTVDISGLTRKEAARKLGDQWMKDTGYVIDWNTKW